MVPLAQVLLTNIGVDRLMGGDAAGGMAAFARADALGPLPEDQARSVGLARAKCEALHALLSQEPASAARFGALRAHIDDVEQRVADLQWESDEKKAEMEALVESMREVEARYAWIPAAQRRDFAEVARCIAKFGISLS